MTWRIVFCSDTHLGFDLPVRRSRGRQRVRRGEDFFGNFERVLAHAKATRPDLLIHGGDVFSHPRVHVSVVDRAYQLLTECADAGVPVLVVPGNHERAALPPSLWLNHPDIHVFDRPRAFCFESRGTTLAVGGFPYHRGVRPSFRSLVEACFEGCRTQARLLVMHHAVDGATVGPADFVFRGRDDTVSARHLAGSADLVLSGHIHRHQVLRHPQAPPVVFCGSIERTSFAERNETKGFCNISLTPEGDSTVQFCPLPARPMVDFDGRPAADEASLVDAWAAAASAWSPDAIVRVRVAQYPTRSLAEQLAAVHPGVLEWRAPRQPS